MHTNDKDKLGEYAPENENPFEEINKLSDKQLIECLSAQSTDDIIPYLFERYQINCINMHQIDSQKLDFLIESLNDVKEDKEKVLQKIISLVRSVTDYEKTEIPIIELIKEKIENNITKNLTVESLAASIGISKYYMCHIFKKAMGVTIKNYVKKLRIAKAKEYLINTDLSITDIAHECGCESSSYFSEVFIASEHITPSQYRKLLKKSNANDKDVIYFSMLEHMNLLENLEVGNLTKSDKIKSFVVSMPSERYKFLHETAIIEYHNVLFAAWYNNKKVELHGETPIRFSTSSDSGKTWNEPITLSTDKRGEILYCPPVFGICDDKLYMFMNQMVSADHIHSLDLYEYDENKKRLKCFGQNLYRLS